jgi:hypothetical protein
MSLHNDFKSCYYYFKNNINCSHAYRQPCPILAILYMYMGFDILAPKDIYIILPILY